MSKKVKGRTTAGEVIHQWVSTAQPVPGHRDWHQPTEDEVKAMLQEDIARQQRQASETVSSLSPCPDGKVWSPIDERCR